MTLRPVLFVGTASLCIVCAGLAAEAKNPPAHGGGMQTGQYHTAITFSHVTGLPMGMAQHMMSHPVLSDGCLNTTDVNAVVQDAIAASANMTCTEDHGSASGGVISGAANCHDQDGNTGALTIAGTYTATHADVNGDLHGHTSIGPVSEHIHLVSDRTGACSSRG